MTRLKQVDAAALRALAAEAAASARRRRNLNLHPSSADPVQRFLNDFEPGTYVRPHRHRDRWELFVLVQGSAAVLTFDDGGCVRERVVLGADAARVVEIPENCWHTLVSLVPGSVLFEVKRGPYQPAATEYAPWAPAEGHPGAPALERRLVTAQPGERIAP